MTNPNEDSAGVLTWDPQAGVYFKPALKTAQGFSGIIGAFQDLAVSTGKEPKDYPYSFAGIISAIQDLTVTSNAGPGADIGPQPIQTRDGQLWFDTRQGRLFVADAGEWYQTNGADGVPIVTASNTTPPSVTNLILGQLWWVADEDNLYIFDGQYELPDGTITTDPSLGGTPLWVLMVDSAGFIQTTGTLPLATQPGGGTYSFDSYSGNIAPVYDPDAILFQKDANEYFVEAIEALDAEAVSQQIYIGELPPNNPTEGKLWFDTGDIEMSIWYVEAGDDVTEGQWVPISASYAFNQSIAALETAFTLEKSTRSAKHTALTAIVDLLRYTTVPLTEQRITDAETKITALENADAIDLSSYASVANMHTLTNNLQTQINTITASEASEDNATSDELALAIAELTTLITARALKSEVTEVQALIPSITDLASTTYVDDKFNSVNSCLPLTGGTVTGAIKLANNNVGSIALDFTTNIADGRKALALKTPQGSTATFGNTSSYHEYAWESTGLKDDFCWIQASTKVASISGSGVASTNFTIGDFLPNDSTGRRLTNTIDVKAKLTSYQTAFEAMRQAVANSTDFATLKTNLTSALTSV